MGWEPEHNLKSLSPCGLKAAEDFAQHIDISAGTEMPPGILGPAPLGAGVSSPYMPEPSVQAARR
jgi:hypothetical protein